MAELSKIMVKIANQQKLSQQELADLERMMTETQNRNALVAKWENSDFTKTDFYHQQLRFQLVGAKVSRTGNVSIANNTTTVFQWTTTDYADIGMVDLVADNTKITITRNGRYSVGINIAMNAISANSWWAQIIVNGVSSPGLTYGAQNISNTTGAINISEDVYLNAGDYVQMQVFQNSGGALNTVGENMYVRQLSSN